jgi:hypothetical protein
VRTTDAAHEAVVRELLERAWTSRAGSGGNGGDGASAPTTTPSSSPSDAPAGDVVYRAAYTGYYCVGCEEYKDESEMVELSEAHPGAGATCCPVHRAPCVERNEVSESDRGGRRGEEGGGRKEVVAHISTKSSARRGTPRAPPLVRLLAHTPSPLLLS